MSGIALKEEVARLQNEAVLAGAETDRRLLDLRAELDRLKLEMMALKAFLVAANPSFAEQFPQVLARTIAEVDPEYN